MSTAFRSLGAAVLAAAVAALPGPAAAHPHVWVIASGELVYAPDGALTGIKYAFEFDQDFSSVATMGLATDGNGRVSGKELAELAKVNVDSLKEFDYFTYAKAGSHKLSFSEPTDYYMEQRDDVLVLHFTLPLAKPQPARGDLRLEVYDPTVLVAFTFAEGDSAVTLSGAPAGCTVAVERPQPIQPGQSLGLSETFFNNLNVSSDFGAQFANRATVSCP